jgi:mono/diheme cytochrome c family protein
MKLLPVLLLLCATTAQATPFAQGNAQAGKKLFDTNRCNQCHMSMQGGDGSSIFTRPDRKVTNPKQLVDQMYVCSGNVGITLSKQDEQDLGAYLNGTYYHFK